MLRVIVSLVAAVFALTLASPVYAQAGKEPATKTETKQPAKPAAPKKAPLDLNTASEDELKPYLGLVTPTQRRSSRTGPMPGRMTS